MRLEDAVVGIIAVESRREHIEKNTIPTLQKAGFAKRFKSMDSTYTAEFVNTEEMTKVQV